MLRSHKSPFGGHVVLKTLLIGGMDVLAISVAFFLGLWLRFDFHFSAIPAVEDHRIRQNFPSNA